MHTTICIRFVTNKSHVFFSNQRNERLFCLLVSLRGNICTVDRIIVLCGSGWFRDGGGNSDVVVAGVLVEKEKYGKSTMLKMAKKRGTRQEIYVLSFVVKFGP